MQKEWLQEQTTVEEIEETSVESIKEDNRESGNKRIPEVPFGFINDCWEVLKAKAEEGDEWWSFCSSQATWNQLAGRAGYALVRKGEITGWIVNCLS